MFNEPETRVVACLPVGHAGLGVAEVHPPGAVAVAGQLGQLRGAEGFVAASAEAIGACAALFFIASVQASQVGRTIADPSKKDAFISFISRKVF